MNNIKAPYLVSALEVSLNSLQILRWPIVPEQSFHSNCPLCERAIRDIFRVQRIALFHFQYAVVGRLKLSFVSRTKQCYHDQTTQELHGRLHRRFRIENLKE